MYKIMYSKIMKLSMLLFIAFTFSMSANTYAQTHMLTIDKSNVTIAELFSDIEEMSEFSFLYSTREIDVAQRVSVRGTNMLIADILSSILAGKGIDYRITDRHIILYKADSAIENANFTLPSQQVITVTGTVVDETGETIPGANVTVRGTPVGVITDPNGRYSINAPDGNAVLVFSFLGYASQEILVGSQRSINVTLVADASQFEELVVVGYGSMRRSDITGSVGSVPQSALSGRANLNINQALQGQIPGVIVTGRDGQPGSSPSVRIRGIGTFNNNDPLYVVDGVPLTNDNGIDIINNQDIESIEVLKDAASASIYGSRAGAGVILITTKRGTAGKPVVFYDVNLGFHEASNRLDLLNAREFTMIMDEALVNSGHDPVWRGSTGRADTDWQDQIFQRGFIQSHSVGVRGSKDDVRYYLSAGYDAQDGTLLETLYQRYSIKSNVDVNVTNKLLVGMNLSYIFRNDVGIEQGSNSVLMNAVRMPATVPAYNDDGTLGFPIGSEGDGQNPVGYAQRSKSINNGYRMLINLFADYKIFPSLVFRTSFSGDMMSGDGRRFLPIFQEGGARRDVNELTENHWTNRGITFENFLTFNQTFAGKHNFTAMAGQSLITFESKRTEARRRGFPSNDDNMRFFDAGTIEDWVRGNKSEWALLSYFGRINYNFDNRYLFQFNLRADGSSRFGKNSRWGTFPSVAVGWRVSQEQFMQNVDWLSDLRIRGSYGVLGVQPNQIYGFTTTMGTSRYILGTNQQVATGYSPGGMSNDNFQWETMYHTNIGVDFGLFRNKLSFTVEYYNKYTKGILQNIQLMGIAGTGGRLTNIGEMLNTGFEFSFSWNDRIGDFGYNINANMSTSKNEVKKLFDNDSPINSGVCRTEVGQPIGQIYGYVTDGVFQNQGEIDAHRVQPNAVPGEIRFKNLEPDDRLDAGDMTFIGNPLPPFTYGLNLGFDYKGIDFSVFLRGVAGNDIYYNGRNYLINGGNNFNKSKDILDRWQKEGDITDIPRVAITSSNDNFRRSTLFVESGAYLRIANIQAGYTLNPEWINRIGVRSARIYVSANNLFTFTKYSGFDPEVNASNPFEAGIDRITFPLPRTILFGINLTL